ncbi:hypothetical protein WR25_12815 [Diploscapter pachys]|uniref:PH domain-containing protein n=1 Tax=Diploscapter pachys TaxID=2018661 RepID=A0A2A2KXG8_9BILA|nr:hypothetical protein WR25_12815 [Diploscapter pachys]
MSRAMRRASLGALSLLSGGACGHHSSKKNSHDASAGHSSHLPANHKDDKPHRRPRLMSSAAAFDETKEQTQSKETPPEEPRKSLKKQKKNYRDEKKKVTAQLVSALQDPTVVVMADWLKIRGVTKKWSKYWCVLKPGLLIIYKTPNAHRGDWIGTVLLNLCELIERPSKKDGFCFKLYHPMDGSIWGNRGPHGQSFGSFTLNPLYTSCLICRAPSDQAGRCWMDALELSFKCTGLLKRTMITLNANNNEDNNTTLNSTTHSQNGMETDKERHGLDEESEDEILDRKDQDEVEAEKHFEEIDAEEANQSDDSDHLIEEKESNWIQSEQEAIVQMASGSQTEEVADEYKSIIWALMKQVRPGMDLSRVVLPTFILEPRSFLEKLADYYYHADLLADAAVEPDPYQRIIKITRFYLSGFYKKPKGIKKPYNPILGETFRCSWKHPDGSTTFYIAEQVSHHPPVSSLFVTNRKAGFNICGTILAKSKFYGNSTSAILAGNLKVTLLNLGETYTVNLPYANCKGIIIGAMTMELGGTVNIECEKTGYSATLEFLLKPMLGGSMNKVKGSIRLGSQELSEINGHWDEQVTIKQIKEGTKTDLWKVTPELIRTRLPRYEINYDDLNSFESRKLWMEVSKAIQNEDQDKATEEKTKLENDQRVRAKSGIEHQQKYFERKNEDEYVYKYAEYRPWDPHNDVKQIECDYVVKTVTKFRAKHKPRKKGISTASEGVSDISSEIDYDEHLASRKRLRQHLSPGRENSNIEKLIDDVKEVGRSTQVVLRSLEFKVDRLQQHMSSLSIYKLLFILGFFTVIHSIVLSYIIRKKVESEMKYQ